MNEHEMLIEATIKLVTLSHKEDWSNELLFKAPPVMWFGDSKCEKEKILTIGANPSRWEFLNQSDMKSCLRPCQSACYENKYLSKQRFYHLTKDNNLSDILNHESLRDKIINSYDTYFAENPYKWFGSNKNDSYNVEGVLRGLEASYFNIDSKFRACHIDIFPFATISDFKRIQKIAERDVFTNNWAKNLVDEILVYFEPEVVLIFGRTNFDIFCEYFNVKPIEEQIFRAHFGKGNCFVWLAHYNNYMTLGVSVNLGNPKGFDKVGLRELGIFLSNKLNPR
jgi:hypothetical protein